MRKIIAKGRGREKREGKLTMIVIKKDREGNDGVEWKGAVRGWRG